MSAAIELYYSVEQVALLCGYGEQWVRVKVAAGEFNDPEAVDPDSDLSVVMIPDIRISASGVNRFLKRHVRRGVNPIKARNMAELRRKDAAQRAVFSGGGN